LRDDALHGRKPRRIIKVLSKNSFSYAARINWLRESDLVRSQRVLSRDGRCSPR
jgi:hypothetical protein